MNDEVHLHCREIDRCNQRGKRMLSMVDLIDAGTFSRGLAAYALAAIGKGASFMVGAVPSGAGKTTVMGALLNFVPADRPLMTAENMAAVERGMASRKPACHLCHEIGSGGYFAYLWGAELRKYFELPSRGHMLATNLHADTLDQAEQQVCGDNQVPATAFRKMNLLLFLGLKRGAGGDIRRIATVWESDGLSAHRLLFQDGLTAVEGADSRLVTAKDMKKARSVIDGLMESGVRSTAEVRKAILEQRAEG